MKVHGSIVILPLYLFFNFIFPTLINYWWPQNSFCCLEIVSCIGASLILAFILSRQHLRHPAKHKVNLGLLINILNITAIPFVYSRFIVSHSSENTLQTFLIVLIAVTLLNLFLIGLGQRKSVSYYE